MDKGAAKAEGGTPAPRGVNVYRKFGHAVFETCE